MRATTLASDKGLGLSLDVASDVPDHIVTNFKRVGQILKNLASNALKFTEKGKVQIRFHRPASDVDLSGSGMGPSAAIAISVTDTGIKIAADKQRVIFEAFQQADGSTVRKYGGTALGLSISREFAKLLGGEIQLKSRLGTGSKFTFYLPFEIKAPREITPRTADAPFDSPARTETAASDASGTRRSRLHHTGRLDRSHLEMVSLRRRALVRGQGVIREFGGPNDRRTTQPSNKGASLTGSGPGKSGLEHSNHRGRCRLRADPGDPLP